MVEAAQDAYQVPFTYRKYFNTEQITEMVNSFKSYDANANGSIDAAEFKNALKGMGHDNVSDEEVSSMLKRVDKNEDGTIDWIEFLDMMQLVKKSGQTNFGQALVTKSGQAAAAVTTSSGGSHQYLMEEVSMITRAINRSCKNDELLQERLPLDPESEDLFHACSDGMVMIHLLKHIDDDCIDLRTVNKGSNINIYKVRENLDQAFAVAKTIIKIVGIDAQSFLDKTSYLILGVMWQLVRLLSMKSISLGDCPEIYRLLKEGEELADLQKCKSEDILVRWMNFHLKAAGQPEIRNLGGDLKDSKKLLYVLNQLDGANCSLDALEEADDTVRAQKAIDNATAMGVEDCIGARDLVKGNAKVNSVFVAAIFNKKHGLQELTQEEFEAAGIIDDDIAGSREERSHRMWINSLQIPDCFVENLYEEVRDGLVILRVCHRVDDKSCDLSQANLKPKNMFDCNHNCDMAEDAMKKIGVKMVGVGSQDIREGVKKNILAMVWQLMRQHYIRLVGSKTEQDLLNWVNESCQLETPLTNFGDEQFASGKLLIKLASVIEPRMINWDLVTEGESDEDKMMNAKYAISIARKLGAIIFCVWDDIPNLNKKMILIFVCSLYDLKHNIA